MSSGDDTNLVERDPVDIEIGLQDATPEKAPEKQAGTSPNGSPSGDSVKPAVMNVKTAAQASKERLLTHRNTSNAGKDDTVSWHDGAAPHIKQFQCPVGDRYIRHESTLEHVRSVTLRFLEHIAFRAITILLIIVDLTIVITSIVVFETSDPTDEKIGAKLDAMDFTALAFSLYFLLEISLRIFAHTPRVFIRDPLEIIDAVVVVVSLIIVIVDLSIEAEAAKFLKIIQGLRLVRLVRFAMLIRIMFTQRRLLAKASRLLVSENKRRYQKDGFDLDLCYITDRVIAMSFPSQGIMSIYRNPIEEVSRFFNTKYLNHYRIYNCCSERSYDSDKYFSNSVVRMMIDDHNVPTLESMLEFVDDVQQWMDKDRNNIIAIHCKGGKGRTGTVVCTWLLHSKAFSNAEDALDYFASRRTDLSVGSKFQGVETPSQSRYVKYYERILAEHDGKLPPEKALRLTKISVSGLKGVGTGDGKDLSVKIIKSDDIEFEAKFGSQTNCSTLFERESHTISATLMNCPVLTGDIKVIFDANSDIPRDYDDCPWFFWFNTSFIDNDELVLSREDLDNPHKTKSWKIYKPEFMVSLQFADPSDPE